MSLFEEIYGFESSPQPAPKPLPDTVVESWRWQNAPATCAADATCQQIESTVLMKEILGESYAQLSAHAPVPTPPPPAADPIEAALTMYFAKGAAGGELRRKVQKAGLGVSEAMLALLGKFQEFFTLHEQRIMDGKIKCLDVPGFLEMLNSKLEVA